MKQCSLLKDQVTEHLTSAQESDVIAEHQKQGLEQSANNCLQMSVVLH